jgi:amino acid transporter
MLNEEERLIERKKVLGFRDLVLFSFCGIFGVEAIAASAAIGPSAIFWWLVCICGYFLPFGLIAAELGSTYPEQGGIYGWIKRALGGKWAARTTWYYWIALPLWLSGIYIAIAEMAGHMFFPGMGLTGKILLGIIMIWAIVGINICSLESSKWVPNIGSITQLAVVIGVIVAAVITFLKTGCFATEINMATLMPDLKAEIAFIPMIIYNLFGCELVLGAAGEMKNPGRDVPRALILSAIVIALLYLIATFAIWVVIPVADINIAGGILQVFRIVFGNQGIGQIIVIIFGLNIMANLFTGIVPWTLGENRTIAEAARNGELPEIFGKITKRNMAPVGASIISGLISTVVIVIYGLIARSAAELFWQIISFSCVVNMLSYLILFPVFVILRKKDRDTKRPYRIPGPDWFAILLAIMAEIVVFVAVLIWIIQPGHEFARAALPIMVGVLITVLVGEVLVAHSARKPNIASR